MRGRLVGAPHMNQRPDFDRAICLPAFRCEIWQGFIFVTWRPRRRHWRPGSPPEAIRNYHLEEMKLHYVTEASGVTISA